MQLKAYILVFDGLADWEPALALCEINKSKKFDIVSVGFSDNTVTTMGGYKISPDITLDAMKLENSGEPSFVIDATAMSSCTTTVYNHTIPPGGGRGSLGV